MKKSPPLIAITLGDPGGIGPEVTVKALAQLVSEEGLGRASYLLIGPAAVFEEMAARGKPRLRFACLRNFSGRDVRRERINIWDPGLPCRYVRARVSRGNAVMAFASLGRAADLAVKGECQGVVTAPVHKEAMRLVDRRFIGHTEYLAEVAGVSQYAMMFDGGAIRVTLVTIHIPLREVSAQVTRAGIESKIELTDRFLRRYYRMRRPRLAVTALNPHGREFGLEEEAKILPAVKAMKKKGVAVAGPFPGDEIFHEACRGRYDAVIAMYHDQGLGPLKTVAFDRAVNVTLGLPFVRTSPDHGTAFDIAFRGAAQPGSMAAAIRLAVSLARR